MKVHLYQNAIRRCIYTVNNILQFLFIVIVILHDGQFFQDSSFRIETGCFKGTISVISSEPLCKDDNA